MVSELRYGDYEQEFNAALDDYKEQKDIYDSLVSTPRYLEIVSIMPFEFLNAKQLCEKLSLYEKLDVKPRLFFRSYDEAVLFYYNLVNFKSRSKDLLSDAAYMSRVGQIAEKLNKMVLENPYLGESYCVIPNMDIIKIAEECIREIPQYPKHLTKAFRLNFIESALISLSAEEVIRMAEVNKIIKDTDLEKLSLIENANGYQEKLKSLFTYFGKPLPEFVETQEKLVGVTFDDENGIPIQQTLHELQDYCAINPGATIKLRPVPYMFTPESGIPEPAIAIYWQDRRIGHLGKDVVKKIYDQYDNPQFIATVSTIYGGADGGNVGCKINLSIISVEKKKEITQEKEQE